MADLVYEWDDAKRDANVAKHGLDFADLACFDLAHALVMPDDRRDYGEPRFRAFGRIGEIACVLVFTRRGPAHRVISLRRASDRERRRYGL